MLTKPRESQKFAFYGPLKDLFGDAAHMPPNGTSQLHYHAEGIAKANANRDYAENYAFPTKRKPQRPSWFWPMAKKAIDPYGRPMAAFAAKPIRKDGFLMVLHEAPCHHNQLFSHRPPLPPKPFSPHGPGRVQPQPTPVRARAQATASSSGRAKPPPVGLGLN